MMVQKADVGRQVLYHPIGGPPLVGVITGVGERRVFVKLGRRSYNLAVSPTDLLFWEPPQSFGPDCVLQSSNRYA